MSNTRDLKRYINTNYEIDYFLNTPGNGSELLYIDDPHIRLQKWGANLAENTLSMNKEFTQCGKERTVNPFLGTSNNYSTFSNIFTDNQRLINPAWNIRDKDETIRRLHYPILDPQENVWKMFHNNLQTRILEKDNFKK